MYTTSNLKRFKSSSNLLYHSDSKHQIFCAQYNTLDITAFKGPACPYIESSFYRETFIGRVLKIKYVGTRKKSVILEGRLHQRSVLARVRRTGIKLEL